MSEHKKLPNGKYAPVMPGDVMLKHADDFQFKRLLGQIVNQCLLENDQPRLEKPDALVKITSLYTFIVNECNWPEATGDKVMRAIHRGMYIDKDRGLTIKVNISNIKMWIRAYVQEVKPQTFGDKKKDNFPELKPRETGEAYQRLMKKFGIDNNNKNQTP